MSGQPPFPYLLFMTYKNFKSLALPGKAQDFQSLAICAASALQDYLDE